MDEKIQEMMPLFEKVIEVINKYPGAVKLIEEEGGYFFDVDISKL